MSQPYLFYSDRCANSQQIISTITGLNKSALYKFIAVESIPRDKIPVFLKKIPTLYFPETKDVIVGKDIFGYIVKPTNSRKELPTKEAVATGGASAAVPGEYSPWGFEGAGKIGETYSLWNAPSQFASDGNSMYTYISGNTALMSPQPSTKNTLEDKGASTGDIEKRLAEMTKQRDVEYAGVTRQ